MGLSMTETLDNGVTLGYFRIVKVTIVVNKNCVVEIAGYVDQDARTREDKNLSQNRITTQLIELPYDPEMSVSKAYALLKQQDGYSEATDIIDAWAPGIAYHTDDLCMYDGVQYRCLQAHTSQYDWEPLSVPALWIADRPEGDISEWVQPDSTNPYNKGDRVIFEGSIYESLIDNNVWSPSAYPTGWVKIEN